MIHDLTLGQRLKKALDDHGMMQKELAAEIGVNEMAISRYVHGGRMVSVSILIDICKALNISADYLLGLSEVEE